MCKPGLDFIHSEGFWSTEVVCQFIRQGRQNLCVQSRVRFGVFSTQMGQGSVVFCCVLVLLRRFVGVESLEEGVDGGVDEISLSSEEVAAVDASLFSKTFCSSRW